MAPNKIEYLSSETTLSTIDKGSIKKMSLNKYLGNFLEGLQGLVMETININSKNDFIKLYIQYGRGTGKQSP